MPQMNVNPVQMMGGINEGFNNMIGPAAGIIQAIIAIILIAVLAIIIINKFKYSTKVLFVRERFGGTEYVLTNAAKDSNKNVYVIKMKGFEKPRYKRIPLPVSGELIARTGKSPLIVLRELSTGELRYCTHPDVSGIAFKTLSADYRSFNLTDQEETVKRVTAMTFWKEHGAAIVQVGGMALIFILSIMLLDKFQDVSGAAAQIVAQMKELSCSQVIAG